MNKPSSSALMAITVLTSLSSTAMATTSASNNISSLDGDLNLSAISMFTLFITVTLLITWWAAKKTKSKKDFYTAGGRITGFQNGLAIAGDFMSAATFLGITGLVYSIGFDVALYVLAGMVGLCLLLILLAEPFRNLGRFTLADVACYRLREKPVRTFAATTSLVIIIMYLVVQMVGAGALIQLLFGLSYTHAVMIVGTLMIIYVSVGGMLATTWVQIIKAVLMLFAISMLAIGTMYHFNFSFTQLYKEATNSHPLGIKILAPGILLKDPVSMVSLSLALSFGLVGMPHVLMRLFTVQNVKEAYRSVLYASFFIGYVFMLIFFIIGFGAIALLHQHPELFDASGKIIGGSNMVAIHLSRVIGGDIFLGFISAVVFATILAVVAGLTLAGASAISHDLYVNVLRHEDTSEKKEIRISRIATVCLGIISIALAILFEGQNIAYLMTMVYAISASANFPLLILAVYWRGLTTKGAVVGGSIGLITAISLVVLGPTIWVQILGNQTAVFPYEFPALFSITVSFASIWIISLMDKGTMAESDRQQYDALLADVYLSTAIKETDIPYNHAND